MTPGIYRRLTRFHVAASPQLSHIWHHHEHQWDVSKGVSNTELSHPFPLPAGQRDVAFNALNFGRPRPVDPFAMVADELSGITDRMRKMVVSEIPKLASAAEYFFMTGAHGKRFRPTVLLLMASALGYKNPSSQLLATPAFMDNSRPPFPVAAAAAAAATAATVASKALGKLSGIPSPLESMSALPPQFHSVEEFHLWQRQRQRTVAEITEMIHVASLLHDDVLDQADTRRGVQSLNFVMGNKLAVLAGDFLLARASCALASLRNTEVVELLSTVLEHLVGGEIMQMTAEKTDISSMDYYLRKTFLKTASLMAHSCKAVSVLGGHTADVSNLAYDYGRNLGLAFQLVDDALDYSGTSSGLGKPALNDIKQGLVTAPVLFALRDHPQLQQLADRKFQAPGDVDQAVSWVKQSNGVERTKQFAEEHSEKARDAVAGFPPPRSSQEEKSREGLLELTRIVLTRSK